MDTGLEKLAEQLFSDKDQITDGHVLEEDEEGYIMVQEKSPPSELVYRSGASALRKRYQRKYSVTDAGLTHPFIQLSSESNNSTQLGQQRPRSLPLKLHFQLTDSLPISPTLAKAPPSQHHSHNGSTKQASSQRKTPPPTPPRRKHSSRTQGLNC